MNRSSAVALLTCLALTIVPALAAAEDTATTTRQDRMEGRIEKMEERQDMRDQKMTERASTTEERMAERQALMEERGMKLEAKRGEWEANIEERREKWAEKASTTEARTQERKLKLEDKKKERVEKIGEHVAETLTHLVDKLHDISAKVAAFIVKAEEKGADTSEADAFLEEGDFYVENAEKDIAGLDTAIDEIISGEFTRDDIHALVQPIRENLRAAKDSYVSAIQSLRGQAKDEEAQDDDAATGTTTDSN